jgi:hypothetical protein
MLRFLQALALMMLLASLSAPPVGALTPLPPTVPQGVTPQWAPVSGSPGVEYAPNLKVDLFRHQGLYYYWIAGGWRVGKTPAGPWQPASQVPAAIRRLDPARFKSLIKPPASGSVNR